MQSLAVQPSEAVPNSHLVTGFSFSEQQFHSPGGQSNAALLNSRYSHDVENRTYQVLHPSSVPCTDLKTVLSIGSGSGLAVSKLLAAFSFLKKHRPTEKLRLYDQDWKYKLFYTVLWVNSLVGIVTIGLNSRLECRAAFSLA